MSQSTLRLTNICFFFISKLYLSPFQVLSIYDITCASFLRSIRSLPFDKILYVSSLHTEIHEPKWQLSVLHGFWYETAERITLSEKHSNAEKRGRDSVGPGSKEFWHPSRLLQEYSIPKVKNSLSLSLASIP